MGVWGTGVDGRQVFRTLSTANRERCASCRAVRRDVTMRGLQTPVTSTTEGAPGRTKAVDCVWPRSLRIRCGLHQRQPLMSTVPPLAWPACNALGADLRDAPTFAEGQRR
jgi:putative transposase